MATYTTIFEVTHRDDALPAPAALATDRRHFCEEAARFFEGLGGGWRNADMAVRRDGDAVAASGMVTLVGATGTAASGSVALSGVGGTAASASVELAGGADGVTVTINGIAVGPVGAALSDAETASDVAAAINAHPTASLIVTASALTEIITITANAKGTAGNYTLTAGTTAGTATASAATLEGGADGSVGVTINGTLVTTDTTNLSDNAAATAVVAAIEANGTLGPLLAATADGSDVDLVWGTKGAVGNAVTLSSTSATGTATASGATLAGGADNTTTVTINGVAIATNVTLAASDTAAAALVAASIEAEANALVAGVVTATSALGVVTLTADAKGTTGNWVTLAASQTSGTATASGARLTGGTDATVTEARF